MSYLRVRRLFVIVRGRLPRWTSYGGVLVVVWHVYILQKISDYQLSKPPKPSDLAFFLGGSTMSTICSSLSSLVPRAKYLPIPPPSSTTFPSALTLFPVQVILSSSV